MRMERLEKVRRGGIKNRYLYACECEVAESWIQSSNTDVRVRLLLFIALFYTQVWVEFSARKADCERGKEN